MADKYRFYVVCQSCHGTGTRASSVAGVPVEVPCKHCQSDEVLDSKLFDGLWHVYQGRFEEVDE